MPLLVERWPIRDMSPQPVGLGGDPRAGERSTYTSGVHCGTSRSASVEVGRRRLTVTTTLAAPAWSLSWVGRAGGDHPALVDHDDVVAELVGLLEVLRGQQQRGAVGDQAAQHLPQVGAAARVETGGRLVEEQHRRRRDQADREVEPAAHAAGVGLDRPVGGVGQREPLEQVVAEPPDRALAAGRRADRSARGSPGR